MIDPGVKPSVSTPSLEYFPLFTLGQNVFLHPGIKLERSEEKAVLDQIKQYWVQIQGVATAKFPDLPKSTLPWE